MLEKLKVSEDLHDAQNLSSALLTPVGHVINLPARKQDADLRHRAH